MRHMLRALVLALVLAPAAHAATAPDPANDYVASEAYIPTSDPTVELHADVLRPKNLPADAKTPVIMTVSPYLNHSGETITDFDPTRSGPDLYNTEFNTISRPWAHGYTVVLVDLPGFGGSSGCNDFGGPVEQNAVKTAVEWAADQSWSTGKVGLFGKSYDGWTVVMGMAENPKGLAAVVPEAAIIDGYRTLYQNGEHYGEGWYATPAVYQAQDAMPGTVNDNPTYWEHVALGTNPACETANILEQDGLWDEDDPLGFWAQRNLIARASQSTVPTFWEQGFLDVNVKPDNFLDVYSHLRGPKRAWVWQGLHDRPTKALTGRDGYYVEVIKFFDHYLKGDTSNPDSTAPAVEVQDNLGKWRSETEWPPADASPFSIAIKSGTYTDDTSHSAEAGSTLGTPGTGDWSISQALPYQVHIAGVTKATADVTVTVPRTNLSVLLYDIDATGKTTLITRGVYAVKQSGPVSFELYPEDWRVLAGHRIGVLVTGADESLVNPPPTQTTVTVNGGSVSIPALRHLRTFNLSGGASAAMKARPVPFTVDAGTITGASENVTLPPQQDSAP